MAAEDDAGLYAPLCGDDNLQRWEVVGLVVGSGQVRLVNTELCITVGGQHTEAPAGPLVRRDLRIRQCDGDRDQIWDIVE